jgi:hypothetical protein
MYEVINKYIKLNRESYKQHCTAMHLNHSKSNTSGLSSSRAIAISGNIPVIMLE